MTELTMQFTEMTADQFQAHLDERSVNTHDAVRVSTWFSDDAVQRLVGFDATARGRDAIRDAMETFFCAFPDAYLEVRDLFASGYRMCVQCTCTGTHEGEYAGIPPTGRRIELDMCLVFRLGDDGLVDEEVVYTDSGTMFRQLGLLTEA